MGVVAQISGVETTIYMTMGGTFWSKTQAISQVHVGGFDPLNEYVEQFTQAGGKVQVCSPCHDFYCSISTEESSLIEGAELCGLSHIVDMAMDGTGARTPA